MSRAAMPMAQRMPSSSSYKYREHRAGSGYRTSSSDEMMDGDMDMDTTSSSYNDRYPTSEAHLVNSNHSTREEYGYSNNNMAQYASTQQHRPLPSRQPTLPQPAHYSPELSTAYQSDQYAASAAYYTPDGGPLHDKMEYESPILSDTTHPPPSSYAFNSNEDKGATAFRTGAADIGYGMGVMSDKVATDGKRRRKDSGKSMQNQTGPGGVPLGGAGAAGEGVSSIVRGYGTPHQIAYLSVVLLQTLATAAMIAIVWVKIRAGTPVGYNGFTSFFSGNDDVASLRRRTITVYLAIFLFGSVFEIITAIDALRLNNTIQLIGVCLFVIAMMVYSALLGDQIENAISIEDGYSPSLYAEVRPYIIAMPIIQGVAVLVLAYFTYLLFRDFGWEVLHLIGADRKLKRIYTKYQIFVCLVKFDFFFFVGFSLQYMILVLKVQEAEFIITIIAFPFTILALVLAVIAVRREIKSLSYVIFIAELCALAYFIFKFFRLFQPSQAFRYQNSRKTLAVFSALAIVMLLLTFWCSILCFVNYGEGLKDAIPGYFGEHRASRRQKLSRKNSASAGAMLDERPARMSID